MSTQKKSDNTSTTTGHNTANNTASDNKVIFGPLGKYAVVAVFMASTIVTTAIILNKQVDTVGEKIAAIENEVAALNTVDSETVEPGTTVTVQWSDSFANKENVKSVNETQITSEAQENTKTSLSDTAPVEVASVEAAPAELVVATEATAKKTVPDSNHNTKQTPAPAQLARVEPAKTKQPVQTTQPQLAMKNQAVDYKDQQWQARIEAHKLEQKQRMSEMFARIQSLESQQLDKYKASQAKQIERLREQITRQQQMIETLILRNKESLELRAANMQRHQAKRQQMLNRI